jgi:hypothetical protein
VGEADLHYDVCAESLTRSGEELCGDQVKTLRLPEETIVVVADGLGSGVKANVLARLTTEIGATMLRHGVPLPEVLETISSTLPVCRERGVAYAAFAIARVRHADGRFELVSFDLPPPVLLAGRHGARVATRSEAVAGKRIEIGEGSLAPGDFLGLMTDGVPFAGPGRVMDRAWGWDEIAATLEAAARTPHLSAERLVRSVLRETRRRYGDEVGDDATFVGVLPRPARRLMILTGPPREASADEAVAQRLLSFGGRRVVCGGTTANLVAAAAGGVVETDERSAREDVPPIATLRGVHLVTEGILTLAATLRILKEHEQVGTPVPMDRNGAALLAEELVLADSILVLTGESPNPHYQNPLLPRSVSIRRSLVSQLADVLGRLGKEVRLEWC